jgi:hypothetical protein
MRQAIWRSAPALAISSLALFVALGGSVYAAKQAKISGKTIKAKSLPGNRLKPRTVPANRLKPGVLKGIRVSAPLTGIDIVEHTLGQVPSAAHAESAGFAESAGDAQTALNAVNAVDSQTVNGYRAGCGAGQQLFAGACWQNSAYGAALNAPDAATACAVQGGTLPDALQLAAFAKLPDVNLHEDDEWSSDIVNFTAENAYAVATVTSAGAVRSGLVNGAGVSDVRHFRCVIPLLS